MPRSVDPDQRRREIVRATLEVLAEKGVRGLSVRSVAENLGGSTALITHYFPNQQAMLSYVWDSAVDRWNEEVAEVDALSVSAKDRLFNFLVWLLPLTENDRQMERARINLLSGQLLGAAHVDAFMVWDGHARLLLRDRLEGLLPERDIETAVDQLRVTATGIAVSVVERPEAWDTARMVEVMERQLTYLGLLTEGEHLTIDREVEQVL